MHVQDPRQYIADVVEAGGTQFTFHAEALGCDVDRKASVAPDVRKAGMRVDEITPMNIPITLTGGPRPRDPHAV